MRHNDSLSATLNETTGAYVLSLGHGDWNVSGINVTGPDEVQCLSIDDVRSVSTSKVITHYENADGDSLSVDEYDNLNRELRSKGVEDDYDLLFDDLDDEYAYRKFQKSWTAIYRTVVTTSDALPVRVTSVKYDTGSKFIKAPTIIGNMTTDQALYTYDRKSAVVAFAHEAMKSVGCEGIEEERFANQFTARQQTETEKVYFWKSGSVEFWKAFGYYIFSKEWNIKHNPRLSLQDAQAEMEADRAAIFQIVKSKYAQTFGMMDESTALATLEEMQKKAELALRWLDDVTPHRKTQGEYNHARNALRDALDYYQKMMAEQV